MDTKKKRTRIQNLIERLGRPMLIKAIAAKNETGMGEALSNLVLNKDGPRTARSPLVPTSVEKKAFEIFQGYTEILSSWELLQQSTYHLRAYPPYKWFRKKVPHQDFYRYHVEKYIEEVYVLSERVKAFTTKMERRHPQAGAATEMRMHATAFWEMSKGIVRARGSHTHEERLEHDSLTRLAAITSLIKGNTDGKIKIDLPELLDMAARETREYWLDIVVNNNKQFEAFIKHYFNALGNLIETEYEGYIATDELPDT